MSAISSGYTIDFCKDSLGGLKVVHLVPYLDVAYVEDLGEIVNIGLKPNKVFYTFQLIKNVSSFSVTPNKDRASGLISFNESLNLSFNKLKRETSVLVTELMKSAVMAIAEDRNKQYILLGRLGGLVVSSASANSGTSIGDKNGYEVSLTGLAKNISHVSPLFIDNAFNPGTYTRIFVNIFASQFE